VAIRANGVPPDLRSIWKPLSVPFGSVQERSSADEDAELTLRFSGAGNGVTAVVLRNTETLSVTSFPVATSGSPSPLKSPTTHIRVLSPPETSKGTGGWSAPLRALEDGKVMR